MESDSWPGDCAACEVGRCDRCRGVTIEGFGCECADEGHIGAIFEDDDEGDYEFEGGI
jgi:hypothetical protein